MVSIGSLQEYTKDFSVYICQLENNFIANDINNLEKKKGAILNICGHDTYCLAHNLLFPRVPKVLLSEILQLLWDHYFRFNQLKQHESVMVYIAELQKYLSIMHLGIL